ncbi:hypothetical protein E4U44_000859 [Claviceps purpurea]|nr:hypothetical protein E4U44_000859 [Claviceps purpurea]
MSDKYSYGAPDTQSLLLSRFCARTLQPRDRDSSYVRRSHPPIFQVRSRSRGPPLKSDSSKLCREKHRLRESRLYRERHRVPDAGVDRHAAADAQSPESYSTRAPVTCRCLAPRRSRTRFVARRYIGQGRARPQATGPPSPSGNVYQDVVAVGGLKVQEQAVQTAQKVSRDFTNDTMSSGLMGLAFTSINDVQPMQQKTFMDNAKHLLDAPLFTTDLKYQNAPSTTVEASGTGRRPATPSARMPSSRHVTLIHNIADSGTSLMLLPEEIVHAYYKAVPGAYYDKVEVGFVFECATKLPDFSFGVGNANITIPGDFINYSRSCDTECFGGNQTTENGFIIFGDIAFKAALVVFDVGKTRIGWAAKKHVCGGTVWLEQGQGGENEWDMWTCDASSKLNRAEMEVHEKTMDKLL